MVNHTVVLNFAGFENSPIRCFSVSTKQFAVFAQVFLNIRLLNIPQSPRYPSPTNYRAALPAAPVRSRVQYF